MPIETVLSAKGLQTSPNNLGAGSVGALVEASNVMIRYPDVIEPRRGQAEYRQLPTGYPNPKLIRQLMLFNDEVVIQTSQGDVLSPDPSTAGRFEIVASEVVQPSTAGFQQKLKWAVSASNLHLTTQKGMQVLEDLEGTPVRPSGLPFPTQPFIDLYVATDTANNWLDNGNSVAYRIVFGYVDVHDRLYLGPPSPFPITIANTSGAARAVSIRIDTTNLPTIPSGDLFPRLFVQVYRSAEFTTGIEPNDELYLVTERFFQPTETSVITINDETPSNLVGGAKLYTNPTAEGAVQENSPAPFARDVASWDQRLWYANTEQPQSLGLQIVGVGGTTGLQVGDKIRFAYADDSVVVTMEAVSGTPTDIDEFTITTSGTPSENVDNTTRSLALNLDDYFIDPNPLLVKPPCRAFIVPGTATSPSTLFLQGADGVRGDRQAFTVSLIPARISYTAGASTITFGTATDGGYKTGDTIYLTSASGLETTTRTLGTFTGPATWTFTGGSLPIAFASGTTSRSQALASAAFNPQLPIYGFEALDVASSNDAAPNRLYYSKGDLPEAVPVLNYVNVGTSAKAILRIYPNRNRLIVFKEEGTFVVYGGEGVYTVQLLDDTVQILAPDSIASVGSTVFALMDDGVVAITESSLAPVSEVINATLQPYLGTNNRLVTSSLTFGVAHESDQLYSLWLPYVEGVSTYGSVFVYGIRSNAWTTWDLEGTCGRVNPTNDTFYWARKESVGDSYMVMAERHASTIYDYRDDGDEFSRFIPIVVTYAPFVLGNAAASKQLREIHTHFRRAPSTDVVLSWNIQTDIKEAGTDTVRILGPDFEALNSDYIGPFTMPTQARSPVPQQYQRATYYLLRFQGSIQDQYFALNGLSLVYEMTSERTTK